MYLDWSKQWISGVYRALKPTGAFWLAIGDEYAAELKVLSQDVGFHCRSWVIWYYTFGVNCKRKFNRSHAHILYYVADPKRFTFNADAIRVLNQPDIKEKFQSQAAEPVGNKPEEIGRASCRERV